MKTRSKGTPADAVRAREALTQAQTVEQLRQAIAVLLPLDYGLSLEKTAQIIGHTPIWTSRLRNRFLAGEVYDTAPRRGGRYNQHMTEEREREILAPHLAKSHRGEILDVKTITAELETLLGYQRRKYNDQRDDGSGSEPLHGGPTGRHQRVGKHQWR